MESVVSDLALADGVTPSSQQWEFICDLEVDYGSDENAQIVCSALSVDKELQPDKVKRKMSVSQGKLSVSHHREVHKKYCCTKSANRLLDSLGCDSPAEMQAF